MTNEYRSSYVNVSKWKSAAKRSFADYGMILVLLVLCAYYAAATVKEQYREGADAGREVAGKVRSLARAGDYVLVAAQTGSAAEEFAKVASSSLREAGVEVTTAIGEPHDLRGALAKIVEAKQPVRAIAVTRGVAQWALVRDLPSSFPALAEAVVVSPEPYRWPVFLKGSNMRIVADHVVVVAIIAIGMTMVIITGGIDLSVGRLIALSAVVSTFLISDMAGAEQAGAGGIILCCLAGILACALVGFFSGVMVTAFRIPPFIVTLAMMLIAKGLAQIIAGGESIYKLPAALEWLGRGKNLLGIPNTVVMMVVLYALAHILMTRTILGRYIYAVGGNIEAARLSGVPVRRVLLFVYAACGALAGLGGVVEASRLRSGVATLGAGEELNVIAAVVVGGTSLAGGQGRILGTLIGAFIIAVIRNGMDLTGVAPYTQDVVLGAVILGAVLLDMLKKGGLGSLRFLRPVDTGE